MTSQEAQGATPRTNEQILPRVKAMFGEEVVPADFARKLERELAEGDRRLCAALGMKEVSFEEALNVIDGLRDAARSSQPQAGQAGDAPLVRVGSAEFREHVQDAMHALLLQTGEVMKAEAAGQAGELPGMLALAQAVAKGDWPHTMDAKVWAEEFAKGGRMVWSPGGVESDTVEFMLGWFANAIMAGYDTAQSRATPPPVEYTDGWNAAVEAAAKVCEEREERWCGVANNIYRAAGAEARKCARAIRALQAVREKGG